MHARGSGEAARRAKRGRPLPSRAISHARGHCVSRVLLDGLQKKKRLLASPVSRHQSRAWPLRVSRFARRTTEEKETARSLDD